MRGASTQSLTFLPPTLIVSKEEFLFSYLLSLFYFGWESILCNIVDMPPFVGTLSVPFEYAPCALQVHPPGGATALIAVTSPPALRLRGFFIVIPVLSGALLLLLVALLINNIQRHVSSTCVDQRPSGIFEALGFDDSVLPAVKAEDVKRRARGFDFEW